MSDTRKRAAAKLRPVLAALGHGAPDERFEMFVDMLAGMSVPDVVPSDRAFRRVGVTTTKGELEAVVVSADRLIASIKALRAPAIAALADKSLTRLRMIAAIETIRDGASFAELPHDLPLQGIRGRGQGRNHVIGVVASCAHIYEALTGNAAARSNDSKNRPSGPFLSFLNEVLPALGIAVGSTMGGVSTSSLTKDFLAKRAAKNNPNLHEGDQDDRS